MSDPRAENCKGYRLDAGGKVIGVELVYVPRPETQFELVRVDLIDEAAAAGNTVATCVVVDASGIPTADNVYLAWPFPDLVNKQLPGNPNGQHMIVNGYVPPKIGPLALYVGTANGEVDSDVIGGLGLPLNRHVCYRATWRQRSSVVVPPTEPPTQPPAEDPELAKLLGQMLVVASGLAAALGEIAGHVAHIDSVVSAGPGPVRPPLQPPEQPPAVGPVAVGRFALARPVQTGDVTQWFGEHPEVYVADGLAGHEGIDYGVPAGTLVYAAQAGVVTGAHEEGAYGLHVVIEDGGAGVSTVYAHLMALGVSVGQVVAVGDLVGRSGSSGRSDGPHLHFGYKVKDVRNPAYGDWLDPALGRELWKRLYG